MTLLEAEDYRYAIFPGEMHGTWLLLGVIKITSWLSRVLLWKSGLPMVGLKALLI